LRLTKTKLKRKNPISIFGRHLYCLGTSLLFGNISTVWEHLYCLGTSLLFGNISTVWEHLYYLGTSLLFGNISTVWETGKLSNKNVLILSYQKYYFWYFLFSWYPRGFKTYVKFGSGKKYSYLNSPEGSKTYVKFGSGKKYSYLNPPEGSKTYVKTTS